MLETLKKNFPDAEIDFLVNERVSELVSFDPNITNVIPIENDSMKALRKAITKPYDLGIAVRPLFNIALGMFFAKIKFRVGIAYRWYSFLFNIRHHQHRKHSVKHEMRYNLDLLDELGCEQFDGITPKIYTSFEDAKSLTEKLIDSKVDDSRKNIIIHTSSRGSAVVWLQINFKELIRLMVNDISFNYNIILTGTKSDEPAVNSITGNFNEKSNIYSILDLNLRELAVLCKSSVLFIGNSTGPIHIAAAVNTPIIGFYSPRLTESETRWGPVTDKKKIFTLSETNLLHPSPEEVFFFIKYYLNT